MSRRLFFGLAFPQAIPDDLRLNSPLKYSEGVQMITAVITALITLFGGLAAAAASYWFTKQREREAEWRMEKLVHYKAFVESLSGIIENKPSANDHRAFAKASNDLLLFAPLVVIHALNQYKNEIAISNTNRSIKRDEALLATLLIEIRKDLDVRPADDPTSFKAVLWNSGVKPDAP